MSIMPNMLAAHALTGCDTVSSYYGIWKGKALKILKMVNILSLLGDTSISMIWYACMIREASDFIIACYNAAGAKDMTAARKLSWRTKISRGIREHQSYALCHPQQKHSKRMCFMHTCR